VSRRRGLILCLVRVGNAVVEEYSVEEDDRLDGYGLWIMRLADP
jgi:hypothetical protein